MSLNNELLEVLEETRHTSLSDKQTTMLYTDIPDIINRIKEKNPDTECVSWTTLAIDIWHHLLTTCKVDPCFMPNFVVDDSRHVINNAANGSSYSTLASNCVHWRWYSDDDNVPKSIQLMMPTAYEIRVYTRAFDSYIKDHYGSYDNVPMCACIILMANTLFHEFVHFFDNFVTWKKIYTESDEKYLENVRCMYHHYSEYDGTYENEEYTEYRANRFTYLWAHEFFDFPYNHNLMPAPLGKYVSIMRNKNPDYDLIMSTVEMLILDHDLTYHNHNNDEKMQLATRIKEITKQHKKFAKHNPQKFVTIM